MIQMQTSLDVADNSGARRVEMIMPIGGSTGKIASLGDKIKVTVKEASPDGTVKKGTVQNAVIVRTRRGATERRNVHSFRPERRGADQRRRNAYWNARFRPCRSRIAREEFYEDCIAGAGGYISRE